MKPKTIKIIYWVLTGFFVLMMTTSAVADLMKAAEAVTIMTYLGFPLYLIPFMGVAKLLGIIALVAPRFPKLKEWAYAGFVFNLTGGLYAHICSADTAANTSRPVIFLVFLVVSYICYHYKLAVEKKISGPL